MKNVLRRLGGGVSRTGRSLQWLFCRVTGVGCGPRVLRDVLSGEIRALAAGDVFVFQAKAVLTWRSTGLTERKLAEAAARYREDARTLVTQRFGWLAHRHPPVHAADLEFEINHDLRGLGLHYTWWGVEVTCCPELMVRLDRRVSDAMSEPLLAKIKAECAHDYDLRRTELVDQLARRWSEVLEKLREQPLITQAAELTEDQFAGVMTKFKQTRRSDLNEMHDLLDKALSDSKELGIGGFEWAESIDRLLRAMLLELNLRDPGETA